MKKSVMKDCELNFINLDRNEKFSQTLKQFTTRIFARQK